MKKTVLNYGLISGSVAALLMAGTAIYFTRSGDFSNGALIGYTGILLSMAFVFIGIKAYRDNDRDGVLSFGEGFKVGILISIISCLCYTLAWMVVNSLFLPDFMDKYIAYSVEQMKATNPTPEQLSQYMDEMDAYKTMNPVVKNAMVFLEPFPVALIVTVLSAAILQKKAS